MVGGMIDAGVRVHAGVDIYGLALCGLGDLSQQNKTSGADGLCGRKKRRFARPNNAHRTMYSCRSLQHNVNLQKNYLHTSNFR